MITIIEQPNEIVLSRNPVVYKLQTDNFILTAGVKAICGFAAFNNPDAGDTITFTYESEVITFTFATNPDNTGTQIKTNITGLSASNYIYQIVLPALKTNNKLFNDFVIDSTTSSGIVYVRLTARLIGSEYTNVITSSGISLTLLPSTAAGVNEVVRENFKIFCDIYTNDGLSSSLDWQGNTVYTKRISIASEPDSGGFAIFNISDHLNKYVESRRPDYNQGTVVPSQKNSIQYYIRFGESFGATPVDYYTYSSSVRTVVLGGKSRLAYPLSSFYNDVVNLKKTILTTQPIERYVSPTTPSFISFIKYFSDAIAELRVKGYYSDNTTYSYIASEISIPQWNVGTIRVGYADFPGLEIEGKTLLKYDVAIQRLGVDVSQVITFMMDYTNYQYERFILYENSLGAYEVLRCTGILTTGVNYNFDEATKITPYNYTPDAPEEIIYNASKKRTGKLSTGFHKRDFINSLEDFFLSKPKYLIANGGYIHIKAVEKKQDFPSDDAMTFALDFTFEYAFTDNSFTP